MTMNLTEYLASIDERPYKFADRIGLGRPLIYDLIKMEQGKGHRRVLLVNALKIREASEGKIALENLGQSLKP